LEFGAYFRRLEWIFIRDFYVYSEYTAFVTGIFLEIGVMNKFLLRNLMLTGPKIVPFQCLKLSPTVLACTVGPVAYYQKSGQ